jgi:hypothetical protein
MNLVRFFKAEGLSFHVDALKYLQRTLDVQPDEETKKALARTLVDKLQKRTADDLSGIVNKTSLIEALKEIGDEQNKESGEDAISFISAFDCPMFQLNPSKNTYERCAFSIHCKVFRTTFS